ncbi:MAG TPA: DNA polymerase III subunit gamma/tau [Peptococcaceae bacterium]|nr:DNA polymerase III subunit gamma/tau [Peptococcaceae bacterium]
MAYLALYREWRPKTFREMVGQDHVRTILVNALRQNKVAHAYLFSGPRGTGKTTTAKILAKALNCEAREDAEPCNKCASCREIDQGLALDVLEIDAASNRGIDEIRNLRDRVKLAPSGGKYKVYIIDEVHMLTPEAFNALLKTLEEPPANVVFILATTEAHKVPLTILSRVQRFEFHRISAPDIALRLKEVCLALGREVEEKALQVIALKAEGGLRDALSVLDQCLLQEDPIRAEHVYQIIGMVGESYSADLTDALLEEDYGLALAKLEEGVALGRDPRQIIKDLQDYLRQGLLYTAGGQKPLLSPEISSRLIAQSERAGLKKLLSWINILLKGENELRFAANARLAAEMILIQAIYEQDKGPLLDQAGISLPGQTFSPKAREGKAHLLAERKPKPSDVKPDGPPAKPGVKREEALKSSDSDLTSLLKAKWPEILEGVKKGKKSTHAFLLEGTPAQVAGELLYLVFKDQYSFHRDKFTQPENKDIVEKVIERCLGKKLKLTPLLNKEFKELAANFNSGDVEPEKASAENGDLLNTKLRECEDSCVQQAVELFGAELVEVKEET